MSAENVSKSTTEPPRSKVWFFFSLVIIFVYLIFEVCLNLTLVNTYGEVSHKLLNEESFFERIHQIELIGRYVTGFGLAYLISGIVHAFFVKSWAINGVLKSIFTFFVFCILWLCIASGLKVFVEGLIHSSSPERKFSAVRAIMFKDMFVQGGLELENFSVLHDAIKNPDTTKFVTALIPSLIYVSKDIDQKVAKQTNLILATYKDDFQANSYIDTIKPIRQSLKSYADNEFDLYDEYRTSYKRQLKNTTADAIQSNANKVLLVAKNKENEIWQQLQLDIENRQDWVNYVHTNQDFIVKYRKLYQKKKCYKDKHLNSKTNPNRCALFRSMREINQVLDDHRLAPMDAKFWFTSDFLKWATEWLTLPITLIGGLTEEVFSCAWKEDPEERENCGYIKTSVFKRRVAFEKFEQAHNLWLTNKWPFDLTVTRAQFNQLPYIRNETRKAAMAAVKITLPKDWGLHEDTFIYKHYKSAAELAAANVLKDYRQKSALDLSLTKRYSFKNRNDFYRLKLLTNHYADQLGDNHYEGYTPVHSTLESYTKWKANQPRSLDVVKMFTMKAEDGFRPGGPFYQLGIEAVTFTIVPTVSIALSVLSVLLMCIKIIIVPTYHLLDRKYGRKRTVALCSLVFAVVMSVPAWSGDFQKGVNNYQKQSSIEESTFESLQWWLLGYILDAEKMVIDIGAEVGLKLDVTKILQSPAVKVVSKLDKQVYPYLSDLNDILFPKQSIINPTVNVMMYDQRFDFAFTMGITIEDNKVSHVKIPSIFADDDFNTLLEAQVFFKPDYMEMFKVSLMSDILDEEFLIDISHGEILRESALARMEAYIKKRLNKRQSLITQIAKQGKGNIVLISTKRSQKYQCYFLPKITLTELPRLFKGSLAGQTQRSCKWVM